MESEKLKLLKSLRLLDKMPEAQLSSLEKFLKPISLSTGSVVFEEGSKGHSLFFISSGHITISKRVSGKTYKDLAILGPGDCFGEMALVEEVSRSARASAAGPTVVFELGRADLNLWLKSRPELAMGFFAELVQVQSQRLRRTSSELTLLFDLSNLLLEPHASGKDLLLKVLDRVVPHLEGAWSAAAYLYNPFNEEMDLAATRGDFTPVSGALPAASDMRSLWLEDGSYYACLPGEKRPHGYLLLRPQSPLSDEERNELGRTLTTVARLLSSAVENIDFRTEETLRALLKKQSYDARL